MTEVTEILQDVKAGRPGATDALVAALYTELRALARRDLAEERAGHTLQPTALVHEVWMRLFGKDPAAESGFENRAHFFSAASTAVRRVLVDHARRRQAEKRGGARGRVTLSEVDLQDAQSSGPIADADLVALDDALGRLGGFAPEQARVVELRFFGGMTAPEAARALGVSVSTVDRHWRVARAWLRDELAPSDGS